MTTKNHKWEPGIRLEKGGHRIFREVRYPFAAPETCRWAIADNSGGTPDRTEDGVLWLDFSRPLYVATDYCGIPVRCGREELRESRCPCGVDAIAALHAKFPKWELIASESVTQLLKLFGRAPETNATIRERYVVSATQPSADGDCDEVVMDFCDNPDAARDYLTGMIARLIDSHSTRARIAAVYIPENVTDIDAWLWAHMTLWAPNGGA